jgi:hypothetical protein
MSETAENHQPSESSEFCNNDLFILRLEQSKYLVEQTSELRNRIEKHFTDGEKWTKKFRLVAIHRILMRCQEDDDLKYTILCLEKFEVDNVRGAQFIVLEAVYCRRERQQQQKKVVRNGVWLKKEKKQKEKL